MPNHKPYSFDTKKARRLLSKETYPTATVLNEDDEPEVRHHVIPADEVEEVFHKMFPDEEEGSDLHEEFWNYVYYSTRLNVVLGETIIDGEPLKNIA